MGVLGFCHRTESDLFLFVSLTKSVEWLSLLQLTILSRCVIEGLWRFCVVMLLGFFCGCTGFCHRTESSFFLCLFMMFISTLYLPRINNYILNKSRYYDDVFNFEIVR